MEKKSMRLIIILGSSMLLAAIVYKKFLAPAKEQDFGSMGNYQDLNKGKKPKADVYKEKRKADLQKIAEDRKVASLESFLDDRVTKDPFTDTTSLQADNVKSVSKENKNKATFSKEQDESVKEKVVVKYIERPKKKEDEKMEPEVSQAAPRRKAGFSSVTATNSQQQTTLSGASEISIPVVVQETTSVKSGSSIFLITTAPTELDGTTVPANTFITGKVTLGANRLDILVTSFTVGNKSFNKKLLAYSSDGSRGISVEGGVESAAKNDLVNDAVTTVQRSVSVPILRNIPRTGQRALNDPEIRLSKGHSLVLRHEK